MHKKSFVFCGLTLILGCFGAFIRWLQNSTAFETESKLHVSGSGWSAVLIVFGLACAVGLFFAIRSFKGLEAAGEYPRAFHGGPFICTVAAIVSALFIGIGAVVTIAQTVSADKRDILQLLEGVFALVAAICVFVTLRGINGKKKAPGWSFILIVLYLCTRLIVEYKICAPDPTVWHFAVRILAVCSMLLAFYYIAGFSYDRVKPLRTAYFSLITVLLSIVTFADSISFAYHIITAGFAIALLTYAFLLMGNMAPAAEIEDEPEELEAQ